MVVGAVVVVGLLGVVEDAVPCPTCGSRGFVVVGVTCGIRRL